MKSTFWEISERLIKEDAPMGAGGAAPSMGGSDFGGGMPAGGAPPMGGGPMGGGPPMGGPPMGGGPMGGPPMGDLGGMGGPPMGGGGNAPSQKAFELQPTDVWTIINNILDGKKISNGKKTDQTKSNPLQSSSLNQ